jgi:hypothetical protein
VRLTFILIVAERVIFKTIVYVNFQPIKIFHDADQPIRFPVHQMDGNPTVYIGFVSGPIL